jgi:hypothetical protein
MKKIYIAIGVIFLLVIIYTTLTNKSSTKTPAKSTNSQQKPTIVKKIQEFSGRPTPPAGFSWKNCHDSGTGFLLPDGWFYKEESTADTKACFITKEEIKPGEMFQTGLTVNMIRNVPAKLKVKPSIYSDKLIGELQKKYKVGKINTAGQGTPFDIVSIPTYIEGTNGEKISTLQMFIANDTTGTLYVISYEAPESKWDEDWKIGEKILQYLALNANY